MNDTTKASKRKILKLQQELNAAVSMYVLSPHTLSSTEESYVTTIASNVQSLIPLLMSAEVDPEPTPKPTTEG